jgi:flagellar biosynthesis/type III secretory pathway protein FliH
MPKTTQEIIQEFCGKSSLEIHQFIYDIAFDNHTLETKNKKWFSQSEIEKANKSGYDAGYKMGYEFGKKEGLNSKNMSRYSKNMRKE